MHNNLPIGTIYSQSILYYTARLVAGRFLLSGVKSSLKSDEISRVSIKNLSLEIIASCVRLNPKVLYISLQVDDGCEPLVIPILPDEEEDNVAERDYSPSKTQQNEELVKADDFKEKDGEEKLLDIKFDHFGDEDENVSGYFYDFNLELVSADQRINERKGNAGCSSEGIMVQVDVNERRQTAAKEENNGNFENPQDVPVLSDFTGIDEQSLSDVLLYWSHSDPMLRGHVQIIVGNYFMGDSLRWEVADYLIGILIKVSLLFYANTVIVCVYYFVYNKT